MTFRKLFTQGGRVANMLLGIPVFLGVLFYLMAMVTLGTLAQAKMPLAEAQALYFSAPWVWLGGVLPVPGIPLILGFLAVVLSVRVFRDPLTWRTAPVFVAHISVVLLIVAGMANTMGSRMGYVVLVPGAPSTALWQGEPADETTPPSGWPIVGTLPFHLNLQAFERVNHPGTDVPASFTSKVLLLPPGEAQKAIEATISMNKPLRYEGYTLYQASYVETPQGMASVLAVVYDRSRLLPYLATLVLAVGLLWRLGQRMMRGALLGLLLALAGGSAPAYAAEPGLWEGVVIQHQGRLKPLATVAGLLVEDVKGVGVPQHEAEQRLADWMMGSAVGDGTLRMKIANPALVAQLKLPPSPDATYTVPELVMALQPLAPALEQWDKLPEKALTVRQKEVLELVGRVENAMSAARTLVLVRPSLAVSPPVAKLLGITPGMVSPFEVLAHREKLLKALMGKPSPLIQRDLLVLAEQLKRVAPERPNGLLRIIPPAPGSDVWLTPWLAARQPGGLSPLQKDVMDGWGQMAAAYPALTTVGWLEGKARVVKAVGLASVPWRTRLEEFVVAYPPVSWALLPLGLGLLAFLAVPAVWRGVVVNAAVWGGVAVLSVGLAARMAILARPPVATLYESVLFVAWVVLVLGAVLARKYPPAKVGGMALGFLLLGVSHFLTQGHDTMGMLTAVLNTRFWLAVHVLTITAGYGLSLLVGAGAVACWVQRVRELGTAESRAAAQRWLVALMVAALAFTAVGTLLGGVWASESWGRFWGWDPKENGALVLTLWLIALLHVRLLKPLPMRAFLALSALTPVVVALSWFGVNLLSVGLHSYGFISGVAGGLATFCGVMGAVVAGLWLADRAWVKG